MKPSYFVLPEDFKKSVDAALREDDYKKDVTTRLLVSKQQFASAQIMAKQSGCISGLKVAEAVFKKLDPQCKVQFFAEDGDKIFSGKKLLTVRGQAQSILSAERTALNFLQHLSGIATITQQFVQAVKGTKTKICDTRKTVPGLRNLEKYAVRCGGGTNHRLSLAAMALVKDNHWKLLRNTEMQILDLKKQLPRQTKLLIEVETDTQLKLALKLASRAECDIIMLDNFSLPRLKRAVQRIRKSAPKVLIEVSGGVALQTVRSIAQLGVDRISVGAITHSAPAIDISLELS